jgi:hypothetical protein
LRRIREKKQETARQRRKVKNKGEKKKQQQHQQEQEVNGAASDHYPQTSTNYHQLKPQARAPARFFTTLFCSRSQHFTILSSAQLNM